MERGSSKHGPRPDDELEHETDPRRQPPHTEEWRETEPFDEGHLTLPADHEATAPPGTYPRRRRQAVGHRPLPSAAHIPGGSRRLLGYLERTDAPDDVAGAIRSLPADRQFATVSDVARVLSMLTGE
jgi:hypothetical protein